MPYANILMPGENPAIKNLRRLLFEENNQNTGDCRLTEEVCVNTLFTNLPELQSTIIRRKNNEQN